MKTVLSGVNRSSGSSDWLKDMVVNDPDTNDSMVNYESLVIQADKALTAKNKEPLLAVYPSDGHRDFRFAACLRGSQAGQRGCVQAIQQVDHVEGFQETVRTGGS